MTFPSNLIFEFYLEGKHPDAIARILRLSSKHVYKICATKYAPKGGWVKGFPSSLERAKIRDEYLRGATLLALSETYGRPVWTISKVIRNVPKGLASLPDAPKVNPKDMMITPVFPTPIVETKPTWSERINKFFRRLFCG